MIQSRFFSVTISQGNSSQASMESYNMVRRLIRPSLDPSC